MRPLSLLNAYRDVAGELALHGAEGDDGNGVFRVPSCVDKELMLVIASNGHGWDHVSVSRRSRCPTWDEMSQIKSLFFRDEETAVQFHPAKADHINLHNHCLHLWRFQLAKPTMPPKWMVA
jgi:hypothetical protein